MKQFLIITGFTAFSIFVASCSSAPVSHTEVDCETALGTGAVETVDDNGVVTCEK